MGHVEQSSRRANILLSDVLPTLIGLLVVLRIPYGFGRIELCRMALHDIAYTRFGITLEKHANISSGAQDRSSENPCSSFSMQHLAGLPGSVKDKALGRFFPGEPPLWRRSLKDTNPGPTRR
jgi:hypothetical protein